jgi:hypothetical protein
VILQHLEELSKGKLKLVDKSKLASTSDILARQNTPASAANHTNKKKTGGTGGSHNPKQQHNKPKHGHSGGGHGNYKKKA